MAKKKEIKGLPSLEVKPVVEKKVSAIEEPREWNAILEMKEELIALVIKQSKIWLDIDKNLPDGYRYFAIGSFTRLLISEIIIDGHIELLSGDGVEWFESTLKRACYAASFREGIPMKPSVDLQGSRMLNLLREYARAQRQYAVYCSRMTNELQRPLRIQRISVQTFAQYGIGREFNEALVERFYKDNRTKNFYLDGQRYSGMSLWDGAKEPVELGRLVSYQREFELSETTVHDDTDELIIPDRPCILQIEPVGEKEKFFNGDLFLIPEGLPIYIKKGQPHSVPFGLSLGAFTSPILFQVNSETRQRDVEKRTYDFARVFLKWPKF